MAEFFDISTWQELDFFNTGGTRNKAVFENPDTGELYYFKTSLKKEGRDYKHEFWSEILASEIGRELGFNTLRYDIAYHKDVQGKEEIGCLSKSMIDTSRYKLSEGVNYLLAYNPNYNPKDEKNLYTFNFIENALGKSLLKDKMHYVVKTIIFDSLIGNGDRHQENWGFIVPSFQHENKDVKIFIESLMSIFTPIYDSGSSLGRELTDERVDMLLRDSKMLEAYINRSDCKIRWEDKKISHFDLLKRIKENVIYKEIIETEIKRIEKAFNRNSVENVVDSIDKKLPSNLKQHKLPENRKRLIKFFVSLRYERLVKVLT